MKETKYFIQKRRWTKATRKTHNTFWDYAWARHHGEKNPRKR